MTIPNENNNSDGSSSSSSTPSTSFRPPLRRPTRIYRPHSPKPAPDVTKMVQILERFTNPYYDPHPYSTLVSKSAAICERIAHDPRLQDRFRDQIRELVRQYAKHSLPLSRLREACHDHVSDQLYHTIPDIFKLVSGVMWPLYEETLKSIRLAIRDRNVFLSFTVDEFCLIPGCAYVNYLFVIVGVFDRNGHNVLDKYLLKTVHLLKDCDDDMSDEFMKGVLMDSLRLLWPHQDHLIKARRYLTHLITEPELEMDQFFCDLTHQSSAFARLQHLQYTGKHLWQIEHRLRRSHQTVVNVIDTVRCQFHSNSVFRERYLTHAPDHPLPRDFLDAVVYYRDNFEAVQQGVLTRWWNINYDEVRTVLSDVEFMENLDSFASKIELLRSIERANGDDAHFVAHRVASLVKDAVQLYKNIYREDVDKKVADGTAERYKQSILYELEDLCDGDPEDHYMHASGDYQLLMELAKAVTRSQSDNVRTMIDSTITRYHLMKCVAQGKFDTTKPRHWTQHCKQFDVVNGGGAGTDGSGNATKPSGWVQPLCANQMRKCFPGFMDMYQKSYKPVPWKYFDFCSVVYCYAEVSKK